MLTVSLGNVDCNLYNTHTHVHTRSHTRAHTHTDTRMLLCALLLLLGAPPPPPCPLPRISGALPVAPALFGNPEVHLLELPRVW